MEFLRPLQQRFGILSGRQALAPGTFRYKSWNTIQRWKIAQEVGSYRTNHTQSATNFFSRVKWTPGKRGVRWQSSKPSPNPTEHLGSPEPSSLSARMKKLSREYGWSALGVYLGLSALDFPLCFLAVRWLGTDRIGHWEHVVLETFWKGVESVYPDARSKILGKPSEGETELSREGAELNSEGAGAAKTGSAAIWTQLALAYALHKSLIFIRVPLTAGLTPKVVKTLRSWGWNIGKRRH
ncbi:hypothetical protein AAFC00_003546 [Neodothiora populina]|uniref:DUF1279 domain-containing protein n=1 Tax=Neodothiora populina TaxID=2781224 RepID=A0ABR3PEM2_9PEZI